MSKIVNESTIDETNVKQNTVIKYTCRACGGIFEKQYKSYMHNKLCRKCSCKLHRKTIDKVIEIAPNDYNVATKCGKMQKLKFKCVVCGREYILQKRSFNGEFKCRKCKRKETYSKLSEEKKREIIKKAKQTRLEKYGDENYTNASKRKETNLKKYGVENIFMLKEKMEDAKLKKYGNPYYTNAEKIKETMFRKYGGYTWSNKDLRVKCDKTLRERYGFKLEKIVEKVQQTKLEKYNDKNYNNKEKHRETCIINYGVASYSKTTDYIHKALKKYKYDGKQFDSTWELCFWIYATENGHTIVKEPIRFKYEYDGDVHYYFPDFLYDGELIEIKGSQFLKNDTLVNPYDKGQDGLYSAKYKCMIDNGVKILTDVSFAIDYVNKKFTKDYVRLFSTTKEFPLVEISKEPILTKEELSKIWNDKKLIKELAIKSIEYNGKCKLMNIIDEAIIFNKNQNKKGDEL